MSVCCPTYYATSDFTAICRRCFNMPHDIPYKNKFSLNGEIDVP